MPVRACDDRSEPVGPQYLRPSRGEGLHDLRRGKMVAVPRSHRYERETRMHAIEKQAGAAGLAPVVPDLQNVRGERRGLVPEQPLLLGPFSIAHQQHANLAVANQHDDARQIRIDEPRGPGGVGGENGGAETSSIVSRSPGCARVSTALSRRAAAASDSRYDSAGPWKAGVDEQARMQRAQHTRPRHPHGRCAG